MHTPQQHRRRRSDYPAVVWSPARFIVVAALALVLGILRGAQLPPAADAAIVGLALLIAFTAFEALDPMRWKP